MPSAVEQSLEGTPFTPMEIIDSDSRRFVSWASVEVVDKEGEVIPMSEFRKVMPDIMERNGPLMDSHSNRQVGEILNYQFAEKEVDGEKKKGLLILGRIFDHNKHDDRIWKGIKDGEYTGLSFGGGADERVIDVELDDGDSGDILRQIEGFEFSLVKDPANQEATMVAHNELAKRVNPMTVAKKFEMIDKTFTRFPDTSDWNFVEESWEAPDVEDFRNAGFENPFEAFRNVHIVWENEDPEDVDEVSIPVARPTDDGELETPYEALNSAHDLISRESLSDDELEDARLWLENLREEHFPDRANLDKGHSNPTYGEAGEDGEEDGNKGVESLTPEMRDIIVQALSSAYPDMSEEQIDDSLEEIIDFSEPDKGDDKVSQCIEHKVEDEGWDQERAVAACLNMHGKELEKGEILEKVESLLSGEDSNTDKVDKMPEDDGSESETEKVEDNQKADEESQDLVEEVLEAVQPMIEEQVQSAIEEQTPSSEDSEEKQEDDEEEPGEEPGPEDEDSDEEEIDEEQEGKSLTEKVADELGVSTEKVEEQLNELEAEKTEEDTMDDETLEQVTEKISSEVEDKIEKSLEERLPSDGTPRPGQGGGVQKSGSEEVEKGSEREEPAEDELIEKILDGNPLSRQEEIQLEKSKRGDVTQGMTVRG